MPLSEEIWLDTVAYAFTAAAAGAVIIPLYFLCGRGSLLTMPRLRRTRWSGMEVCLAFVILFWLAPGLASGFLDSFDFFDAVFETPPPANRKMIWTALFSTPLALAMLFAALFAISRTRPTHVGLSLTRWSQKAMLGYLGFLAATPVVLGVFYIALLWTPHQPHPLEELSKESLMPVEWVLLFFRATVATALLEEIFFRGILQNWLRRASLFGHLTVIAIIVGLGWLGFFNLLDPVAEKPSKELSPGPLVFATLMALGYGAAFYRVWSGLSGRRDFTAEEWRDSKAKNAYLTILGSAMLFAACHGAWPSPIPLFVFGLCVGYLSYRTQSIMPAIVLHCLFNTVACVDLLLRP